MSGFWLGFTAWLGKAAADVFVFLVGLALFLLWCYGRWALGWLRWKFAGAMCGYRIYRQGWQYQPCDLAPRHRGRHEYTENGMRFSFWGDSTMSGCYRIDMPLVPPSTEGDA